MKIKKIIYPATLSEIKDIEDDNIDIFVEMDDGNSYAFIVITPQNYYTLMDRECLNHIPAMVPCVVVRKLEHEIILQAMESFLEDDGYWFKFYYLAGHHKGVLSTESMEEEIRNIMKEVGTI